MFIIKENKRYLFKQYDTVYGKLVLNRSIILIAFFCEAFAMTISKYQLQMVYKK